MGCTLRGRPSVYAMSSPAAVLLLLSGLVVAQLVLALPTPEDYSRDDVIYDQRQNGSTNYRVHLDGLIVAVLPANALTPLIGGNNTDLQRLEELLGGGEDSDNDKDQADSASTSSAGEQAASPAKPKGKLKLSNLLAPLLRHL